MSYRFIYSVYSVNLSRGVLGITNITPTKHLSTEWTRKLHLSAYHNQCDDMYYSVLTILSKLRRQHTDSAYACARIWHKKVSIRIGNKLWAAHLYHRRRSGYCTSHSSVADQRLFTDIPPARTSADIGSRNETNFCDATGTDVEEIAINELYSLAITANVRFTNTEWVPRRTKCRWGKECWAAAIAENETRRNGVRGENREPICGASWAPLPPALSVGVPVEK